MILAEKSHHHDLLRIRLPDTEDLKFCAWQHFIFQRALLDAKVKLGMESGLAAPLAFGPGEEWRVTTEQVPKGWKVDHIVLIVIFTCSNYHHFQYHSKWKM